jgi:COP9 signalosome complex subunit 2
MLIQTQQLNIPVEDVQELLVTLILDKKISGRIDQVQQRLEIQQK